MPDDPDAAPTAAKPPAEKPGATPVRSKGARPRRTSAPKEPARTAVRAPPAPRAIPRPPAKAPPAATVVDVSELVLGRAASRIAKRLLDGERIVVVNAEKSVVTGSRAMVLETYRANRARGSKRSGPHFPRYPDRIFRRTVRGMLPHLKSRGRVAFDRLEVHIGVPPQFAAAARQSIDDARARPALRAPLTLEELTRLLGARL